MSLARSTRRLLRNPYWRIQTRLRNGRRVRFGQAPYDDLSASLREHGVRFAHHTIDLPAFWSFVERSRYRDLEYYKGGRQHCAINKWLEHYVSIELLQPRPGEVLIDIANCHSPFPDLLKDQFDLEAYRQDLIFPRGIQGHRIGGNANALPLPPQFADLLTLHCSFEHFEGDSDSGFLREAQRILKPGGRLCILPLYTCRDYAIQSDPTTWGARTVRFEPDAVIYLAPGWGETHGRMYDVRHFLDRVVAHLGDLSLTIYVLDNYADVWPECYLKFAALITKPTQITT